MHRDIRQHFNNAQYFGFTGTPRFEENASQDGRSTADIFEKCLHTYLIKDAIRDGNVLGFSVEYINTFDNTLDPIDDTYISNIDENELWMADDRLTMIAEHIINNHHKRRATKCTHRYLPFRAFQWRLNITTFSSNLKKKVNTT